jgi:hypothetical protein
MLTQLAHAGQRLVSILQTGWGWALGIAIAITDYVAGHSFVVFLVTAVTLIDAAWGIAVSIKQGCFTKSELARLTISKLAVYGCALFVFIGLDKFVDTTITASVVGAAIVLVEFWSSCASMLILFPNFLFLRLMKKALVGEIASKLRLSEDEVREMLEGEKKGGKNGTV